MPSIFDRWTRGADGLTRRERLARAELEGAILKAIAPAKAALQEIQAQSSEQEGFIQHLMRQAGGARISAEISSPGKMPTLMSGYYSQATKRIVREMARTHPLILAAMAAYSKMLPQFTRWRDDDDGPGYRIVHPAKYDSDTDASKLTEAPEWKAKARRIRSIMEHPSDDSRLGSTLGHVLEQMLRNWMTWDCVPIAFFVPDSEKASRKIDPKTVVGFKVLDGGCIDPLHETLMRYVQSQSGNESWRRMTYDAIIEAGRRALMAEFPSLTDADIDEHGYIQRTTSGDPVRIFRRDELLVSIRSPQTDPDWGGHGLAPTYQAMFVLQTWLEQLFSRIARAKPGLNHLSQVLALVGAGSTTNMVRDIWRIMTELIQGYQTQLPLIPLPAGVTDIKSIPLDPHGKLNQELTDQANIMVSVFASIFFMDPRDIHLVSAGRAGERGGLQGESAEYSQMITRQEGLSAVLMHLEDILTDIAQFLEGGDVAVEFAGIRQYDSTKTRIETRKAGEFWSLAEDRVAFGEDDRPDGFKPFEIAGKKYDPGKWYKGSAMQVCLQLAMQQIMADQQAQQMEAQTAQGAWDSAQAGPGGMDMGQPMEPDQQPPDGEQGAGESLPPPLPEGEPPVMKSVVVPTGGTTVLTIRRTR